MDLVTILKLIGIILAWLVTVGVPLILSLVKSAKKHKAAKQELEEAKTAAEAAEAEKAKAEAKNDMLKVVNEFIVNAENLYKDIDSVLKSQGKSSAVNKKDSVMSKLQAYAMERGYEFNSEEWSKTVDDIVDVTNQVNVNK